MKKCTCRGERSLYKSENNYPHAPKQLQSGRHFGSSAVLETGLEGGMMRCGTKKTVRNSRPARCAQPTAHYCIMTGAPNSRKYLFVSFYMQLRSGHSP